MSTQSAFTHRNPCGVLRGVDPQEVSDLLSNMLKATDANST